MNRASAIRHLLATSATAILVLGGRLVQAAAPMTTLVSVDAAGTDSGNGPSSARAITPDGRYVLFDSDASDLVGTDSNGATDVFVRDLDLGTTTLVSVNRTGTDSGNSRSYGAAISANGRYVLFSSYASNLVATDTNGTGPPPSEVTLPGSDVFLRDLQLGTTTLISENRSGTDSGNYGSSAVNITPDGRYVVFQSCATDLVVTDTNKCPNVFVRDVGHGTTTLVSVNSTGTATGNDASYAGGITPNGRYVTFESFASDVVATDTNGGFEAHWQDVFLRDLKAATTSLVSVNRAGTDSGNGPSVGGSMTSSGRYVAFQSDASDLVATDTNGFRDVFVRDVNRASTSLVSVNAAGTDSGRGDPNGVSQGGAVTPNGRYVVFESNASDLVAGDTDGVTDVFVRDLKMATTTLVSVNAAGTGGGNHQSFFRGISENGRFVLFESVASDLVADDTNTAGDVFVRDLKVATTMLVSLNGDGTDSGNGNSRGGTISANGRVVIFESDASDLVATDTNATTDVFVRRLF